MQRIITENGISNYRIVTSQTADEAVFYAASQLKKYLDRATGAVVPYFSDRCRKVSPEIRLGDVRGHKEDVSMLKGDGFRIFTDGEDIVITGKKPCGVVYGAFRFLELMVGFRCFTDEVEALDSVDKLTVEDMDMMEEPDFEYRDSYFRMAFDGDYAVKNRLNSSLCLIPEEMGGKLKFYNFHHSFYDLLPPDVYFDEHPEYYSEVDGKRLKEYGQLCLTNEDVFEIALKKVKEWIRARPDCKVFSVAQNDWGNNCTCEKCRALDDSEGGAAGSNLKFVNRIAEEVEKEFPDVLIHTFAYMHTRKAPKTIRPRDNVIVRLCNIECTWDRPVEELAAEDPDCPNAEFLQNIKDWGSMSKHLYLWDYCCNFRFYLMPFPNYHVLAENMKLYKKYNIAGMLQEGNFAYGKIGGLGDLQTYLTARLMWNVNEDVDVIIREFTDGCYGKAAETMREYIDLWETSVKGKGMTLFYELDADFITDELLDRSEELLLKAMEQAESEAVRRRIDREYLGIRFAKIARMPLDAPGRSELADKLYEDVKGHGITEVQERIRLEGSFEHLKKSQYCRTRDLDRDYLYYVMR